MSAGGIECDLLVVGSGAGGLAAAVTAAWHGLEVIVAEKEPVLGGTTAWSGGWMWAPLNPVARRAGIVEDPEAPRTYLRHVLGNHLDAARIDAFLAAAPRMVTFFEENTALQFEGGNQIADTYGNAPGAATSGRSVIAYGRRPATVPEVRELLHLPPTTRGRATILHADPATGWSTLQPPPGRLPNAVPNCERLSAPSLSRPML